MASTTALKGGFHTSDPRLDRVPFHDPRNKDYPIRPLVAGEKLRSYSWRIASMLSPINQGKSGRCTQFGTCNDLLAKPSVVSDDVVQAILEGNLLYWPAQRRDEWEGGEYPGAAPKYSGTSTESTLMVALELNLYGEFRWAFTEREFALGVGHEGPGLLGIPWYTGFYDTDSEGFIHPTGEVEGYHLICATAISLKRDAYFLANTWGDWGVEWMGGYGAWIKRGDLRDFCLPKEVWGEGAFPMKRKRPKLPLPVIT